MHIFAIGLLNAQRFIELEERRVYYLDVTASMVGYGGNQNIWKNVTSNLKSAIDNIQDPNTEIIIKTFTDSSHEIRTLVSARATYEGKKNYKRSFSDIGPKSEYSGSY